MTDVYETAMRSNMPPSGAVNTDPPTPPKNVSDAESLVATSVSVIIKVSGSDADRRVVNRNDRVEAGGIHGHRGKRDDRPGEPGSNGPAPLTGTRLMARLADVRRRRGGRGCRWHAHAAELQVRCVGDRSGFGVERARNTQPTPSLRIGEDGVLSCGGSLLVAERSCHIRSARPLQRDAVVSGAVHRS